MSTHFAASGGSKEKKKGMIGDTPHPGKGLRPLHSRSGQLAGKMGASIPRQRAAALCTPASTTKLFLYLHTTASLPHL